MNIADKFPASGAGSGNVDVLARNRSTIVLLDLLTMLCPFLRDLYKGTPANCSISLKLAMLLILTTGCLTSGRRKMSSSACLDIERRPSVDGLFSLAFLDIERRPCVGGLSSLACIIIERRPHASGLYSFVWVALDRLYDRITGDRFSALNSSRLDQYVITQKSTIAGNRNATKRRVVTMVTATVCIWFLPSLRGAKINLPSLICPVLLSHDFWNKKQRYSVVGRKG